MSEPRDLLAEVKAALKKATPGPWRMGGLDEVVAENGVHVVCFGHDYEDYGAIARDEDANLIAHAPEWLAALVGEVESYTYGHTCHPDGTYDSSGGGICEHCGRTLHEQPGYSDALSKAEAENQRLKAVAEMILALAGVEMPPTLIAAATAALSGGSHD